VKPKVRFTRHAKDKFSVLAAYGFVVSEEQVHETVMRPDSIEEHKSERIAQKRLTKTHVLRVVYRVEDSEIVVITFYPGRRQRYEDTVRS